KLDGSHQHVFEHGVVRHHYVRRGYLHIPTAYHLWTIGAGPTPGIAQLLKELTPVVVEPAHVLCKFVPAPLVFCRPSWLREARIHPEMDDIAIQAISLPFRRILASEDPSDARQLIIDQGVHRIQDDCSQCSWSCLVTARVHPPFRPLVVEPAV